MAKNTILVICEFKTGFALKEFEFSDVPPESSVQIAHSVINFKRISALEQTSCYVQSWFMTKERIITSLWQFVSLPALDRVKKVIKMTKYPSSIKVEKT